MSTAYPLPRDRNGRILIDDSALLDAPPPEATPPAEAPAPAGPPPAAPRRHGGETPTPFGQLRPGGPVGGEPRASSSAGERWQLALGWVAALAILGLAGWALFFAPAPAAAPAETPPVAATGAAGEAPPVAGQAAATPTPTPAAELARAIVVFDVPEGTPVGALEPGRGYTLLEERGGWRQLEVPGSGQVWARAWEMDGEAPPAPTPLPTAAPAPPPPAPVAPRPAAQAPVVVPVGPSVTCMPVVDADNGNRYLGDACGASSEERRARALELLQAAPPPTLQQP